MITTVEKPRKLKINQPTDYENLFLFEKLTLNKWIVDNIEPHKIKSYNGPTSYSLKHHFEYSGRGFYVSNGAMKGAFLAAGFTPKDVYELNWTFTLSKRLFNQPYGK